MYVQGFLNFIFKTAATETVTAKFQGMGIDASTRNEVFRSVLLMM